MKKHILFAASMILANNVFAANVDCGNVVIDEFLAGPTFGSMMHISPNCPGIGGGGWVCLDPNGENMSVEESKRLYSLMVTAFNERSSIRLTVDPSIQATACGAGYDFPSLTDVRVYKQ